MDVYGGEEMFVYWRFIFSRDTGGWQKKKRGSVRRKKHLQSTPRGQARNEAGNYVPPSTKLNAKSKTAVRGANNRAILRAAIEGTRRLLY